MYQENNIDFILADRIHILAREVRTLIHLLEALALSAFLGFLTAIVFYTGWKLI